MTAATFAPGHETLIVADRSMVLHAGGPIPSVCDAVLACDDVDAALRSVDASTSVAGARWDGTVVELWCRGDVSLSAGSSTLRGDVELRREVFDLCLDDGIHISMWVGDTDSRPDELFDVYRVTAGVMAACAGATIITPSARDTDPIDELFGPTMMRDVESAAVRTTEPDDRAGRASAVMVFSSGERVVLDRPVVIGRRPTPVAATGQPDGSAPRLVALSHPSVSRQHAIVRCDRWCATIEDLGSANGTTVEHGDGHLTVLQHATPTDLTMGSRVGLGGAASFVIEAIA